MELNGEIGWGDCLPVDMSLAMFIEKLREMGCEPKQDRTGDYFEKKKKMDIRLGILNILMEDSTGLVKELLTRIEVSEDYFQIHPKYEGLLSKILVNKVKSKYFDLAREEMILVVNAGG